MKSYFKLVMVVWWGALIFAIGLLVWNPLFAQSSIKSPQAIDKCSEKSEPKTPTTSKQQEPYVNMSKEFIVSLSVEFSRLQKEQPAFAILHIENHSSQDLNLKRVFKLNLIKRGEDGAEVAKESFWSPITISRHLAPDVIQNQTGKLKKGETIELRLDLTKLNWGRSTLSVYPSDNLFDIAPRGYYMLRFDVRTDNIGKGINQSATRVQSNELPIFVENDKEIDW